MNKNTQSHDIFEVYGTQNARVDPGFFLGGGALVSCSSSTPINHIVFSFFCRIPVVLENGRSSQRGAHPLHPPPRSAPGMETFCISEIDPLHARKN